MARGPKPTPYHLRAVRGTNKNDPGRENPDTPAVDPHGLGDPPADLTPAAQAIWTEHAPWWPGVTDRLMWREFCVALADAHSFYVECESEGWTFKSDKGNILRHPASTLHRERLDYATKLAAAFGMNPTDRNRIKAKPKPDPNDPAAKFRRRAEATNSGYRDP